MGMKKVIYLFAVVGLSLAAMSVAYAAKPFSQYTDEQKQYFYQCNYSSCYGLMAKGDNSGYQTCNKSCMSAAENYVPAGQHWCTDSDGLNYKMKGVITTDLIPNGISDYVYTWSNGKSAIFEGTCKNNRYQIVQKNCAEMGKKYKAVDGACLSVNNAPEFIDEGNYNPVEYFEMDDGVMYGISFAATDVDGDTLNFYATGLPPGATFVTGTPAQFGVVKYGIFSLSSAANQVGEYNVTFFVSDGMATDSLSVKIVVTDSCPGAGDFKVQVAENTPAGATVQPGQQDIPVSAYSFCASQNAKIQSISVQSSGLNNPTYDFDTVSLYSGKIGSADSQVIGTGFLDSQGKLTFTGLDLVVNKETFTNFYITVDLNGNAPSGSTFKFAVTGLKAVILNTAVVINRDYSSSLENLHGSTFTVADDCQFVVTKGAGISSTLVNGHDVPLLKVMISSNCNEDYSVETIEFEVANNPTYWKVTSFHLYDWFGNPVDGVGGGVGDDYAITAFSDYDNLLEKGQTRSYTLKADFEGLNYASNDMIYVRLGYIILKNSTTAQQISISRGVQFDEISNTLFY